MTTQFHGTERIGLEIVGTIPKNAAESCAGNGLSVDARSGVVPARMTLLALEGVHADAVPQVKLSWVCVLWQVAVLLRDRPAWMIFKADVDRALPRMLVGTILSFPTRKAAMAVNDSQRQLDVVVTSDDKTMLVRCEMHTQSPSRAHDKRRLMVRHGPRFYEVPWDHQPAQSRTAAAAKISVQDLAEETFGHGVAWDEEAVLWRGRAHGCGRAEDMPVV